MKITVCELSDRVEDFENDWEKLKTYLKKEESELLLLPEMPFYPWLAYTNNVDSEKWNEAVRVHDDWLERFDKLGDILVLGSRPVLEDGKPYNEAFGWGQKLGYQGGHKKYYLPEEEGFWEASWYRRGEKEFIAQDLGGLKLGFMICTDMWFTEHAREYGRQGIDVLATPRATELSTADKWIAGGRAAAVMAGAYSISSNRVGENNGVVWGGHGWIIDPDGNVLGVTSEDQPFLTIDLDLEKAKKAKSTYPRYVRE